jgi:Holliday junction DNA helicase RuvA
LCEEAGTVIGRLRGRLARKAPNQIILDVGGVGYRVLVSLATFYALPDESSEVVLEIYTGVREDAIYLYGFQDSREKTLFEQLITVSKIGPKLALNILSGMASADLRVAIAGGDVGRLSTVPGVGVKTAERMVVELRDKIAALEPGMPLHEALPGKDRRTVDDAVAALLNLGYRRKEAERVVARAAREGASGLEELIRASLAFLSK